MAAYSRDFLIAAFLSRYVTLPEAQFTSLCEMACNFYDRVGRDKFRVYCVLDAPALKLYREQL